MNTFREGVTEDILKAAKKEFLELGYSEANLRRISAACKVTTHTIYTRFSDKAGLFDALVKEVADGILNIYTSSLNKAYKGNAGEAIDQGEDGTMEILDYMYQHFDEVKMIVCRSKGSKYENFIDQFVSMEEQFYNDYLKNVLHTEKTISPFFIHVLSKNSLYTYYEIIDHNLSYQEAKEYLSTMVRFNEAGVKELLGL